MSFLLLFCILHLLHISYVLATVGSCAQTQSSYDFVVIGGGTAGLAFASRLSQYRPDDQIIVLEAGEDGCADQRIYIPGNKGTALGTKYDWNFTTIQQPNVLNRSMPQNRGKVLGGSSAINLLVWDRATKAEFDSWYALGNPGWDWESFYPDQLLAENFLHNTSVYDDSGFATGGPIDTEISQYISPQVSAFFPVMQELGVSFNPTSLAGDSLGTSFQPVSVSGNTHRRSYSPDYLKIASSNLCIMVNVRVANIVIEDKDFPTAKGVILTSGQQIMAKKETILSAGSLQSPGILELSGIGDISVLEAAGIETKYELPGVGENLQDHLRIQNSYQLKPGILAADQLRSNTTFRMEQLALYNSSLPNLYWGSRNGFAFLEWDQFQGINADSLINLAIQAVEADNTTVTNQKLQFLIDPSHNINVPQVEIFLSDQYSGRKGYPTENTSAAYRDGFFTLFASLQHLLSHGSVHIQSNNISAQPRIDPNYLSSEYDFSALITAAKYLRKIAMISPVRDYWVSEYEPGAEVQTEEEWRNYVLKSTFSIYHPVGTCAMLPREHGGVVNPELKVYGVDKLRIVDASIMPLLVSAHISTAVYGIAERAAKLVAAEWKDV